MIDLSGAGFCSAKASAADPYSQRFTSAGVISMTGMALLWNRLDHATARAPSDDVIAILGLVFAGCAPDVGGMGASLPCLAQRQA